MSRIVRGSIFGLTRASAQLYWNARGAANGEIQLSGSAQRASAKALERRGLGHFELRTRHRLVPTAWFILAPEHAARR